MSQDVLIVAENVNVANNINASGTMNVSGSLTNQGNSTISGTVSAAKYNVPNLYGGVLQASVSVATASGTSIPIANRVIRISATAVTTSGSCTFAVGTLDGQEVTFVNESANNIIVTGNAQLITTVSANKGAKLTWVATDTVWFWLN